MKTPLAQESCITLGQSTEVIPALDKGFAGFMNDEVKKRQELNGDLT